MKTILFSLFLLLSIGTLPGQGNRTATYKGTTEEIPGEQIRILSYNIKMLPRFIIQTHEGQIRRAKLIPGEIIPDQPDVVVFQELFDDKARRVIHRGMKEVYPYKFGPANKRPLTFKTNSGVVIYSKYPLTYLGEIKFRTCDGPDCLARKGALLVETEIYGQKMQVLGTHLEAGGTREMKIDQYHQILELINTHQQEGVPQFLVGDWNTHKFKKKKDKADLYDIMLDTLGVTDGPVQGDSKFTTDHQRNDMNLEPGKENDVIDFVLYRANGVAYQKVERWVREYEHPWSKTQKSLSDHNSVLMKIEF